MLWNETNAVYLLPYLSTVSPWLWICSAPSSAIFSSCSLEPLFNFPTSVAVHPPFLIPSWTTLIFFSSFSIGLCLFCSGEVQNSGRSSKVQIMLCHERVASFSSGRLSTGSLRRLHQLMHEEDWWAQQPEIWKDENDSWRARVATTLWVQHGKSIPVLESLNRSPAENYRWFCCPIGLLCSGMQDNIAVSTLCTATLGSCPRIPQKIIIKAQTAVPLWLASITFASANLCDSAPDSNLDQYTVFLCGSLQWNGNYMRLLALGSQLRRDDVCYKDCFAFKNSLWLWSVGELYVTASYSRSSPPSPSLYECLCASDCPTVQAACHNAIPLESHTEARASRYFPSLQHGAL